MASVSSNYARALVDVVIEKRLDATKVTEQLQAVVSLVGASAELRNVWENPAVPAEQKRNLLDAIGARIGLDRMVRNFLAVLIDHHRINAIESIARQFSTELNARLGIAQASVTSARELSAAERQALESQIAKLTGKQVRASYAVQGDLLGGAVVRLGSTIYDGSVRGQLEKIKETLSAE